MDWSERANPFFIFQNIYQYYKTLYFGFKIKIKCNFYHSILQNSNCIFENLSIALQNTPFSLFKIRIFLQIISSPKHT